MKQAHLDIFRIVFCTYVLFMFIPDHRWVAQMPDALFDPPFFSLGMLLSGFPSAPFILCMHLLYIVSLVLVGLGIGKRVWGLIATLILFIISTFTFGFGKIDHSILFISVLGVFSLNDWNTCARNSEQKQRSWLAIESSSLLAIFIAFGMFTAGFEKALNWIDLDLNTSGFLAWAYVGYYHLGRTDLLAPLVFHLPNWLVECMDYSAVFLELAAFFVLATGKRLLFAVWLIVLLLFHGANTLLLNIPFHINILVYLVFLLPFLVGTSKYQKPWKPRILLTILVLLAIWQATSLLAPNLPKPAELVFGENQTVFLVYSAICWFGLAAWSALRIRKYAGTLLQQN